MGCRGESKSPLDRAAEAYEQEDFETARDIWHAEAEKGEAEAQYNLGSLYASGKGVPQDFARARQWYARAAEQGDEAAKKRVAQFDAAASGRAAPAARRRSAAPPRAAAPSSAVPAQSSPSSAAPARPSPSRAGGPAGRWVTMSEFALEFPVPEGFRVVSKYDALFIELKNGTGASIQIGDWFCLDKSPRGLAENVLGTLKRSRRDVNMGPFGTATECDPVEGISRTKLSNGWPAYTGSYHCKHRDGRLLEHSYVYFKAPQGLHRVTADGLPVSYIIKLAARARPVSTRTQAESKARPSTPKARAGGERPSLRRLAEEGSTKGKLGSIRANVSIYFGDHDGFYPKSLQELVPRYLPELPSVTIGHHPKTSAVTVYGRQACSGTEVDPGAVRDTGRWGFIRAPKDDCNGSVFVDCTHKDSKGREWYKY